MAARVSCKICRGPVKGRLHCPTCLGYMARAKAAKARFGPTNERSDMRPPQVQAEYERRIAIYTERAAERKPLFG